MHNETTASTATKSLRQLIGQYISLTIAAAGGPERTTDRIDRAFHATARAMKRALLVEEGESLAAENPRYLIPLRKRTYIPFINA